MREDLPRNVLHYDGSRKHQHEGPSGTAVASAALGLVSAALMFLTCAGFPLSCLAAILGIVSLQHFRTAGRQTRCLALLGVATGGAGTAFGMVIILNYFFSGNNSTLMPPAFQSRVFYSQPPVDPKSAQSVKLEGIYMNGHLQRLRVAEVSDDGQLANAYHLKTGDEIIKYNGHAISETDGLKAAIERTIGCSDHQGILTIARKAKVLQLTSGHPPVEGEN